MSRIYKVTTPTGNRLVDANTKAQAISHCVATDYSAEPISSSELYAAISAGATVEKVEIAAGKKSASGSPSTTPSSTATASGNIAGAQRAAMESASPHSSIVGSEISNPPHSLPPVTPSAPANSNTPASNGSLPQPAQGDTSASSLLPQPSGQSGVAQASGAGWSAPASANAPANPILAEQQQINPRAVAAATPIIPIARPATPPAAPGATEGWTPREAN